jgi:predicted nuclease of predicted toxin-antitoxin system
VKLLFDANLSKHLVPALDDLFPGSIHVEDAGLGPDDELIWAHAKANGFAIVSKDTDFYRMSVLWGGPPKVIWLRIGNSSTAAIESVLRSSVNDLSNFENDMAAALLIVSRR